MQYVEWTGHPKTFCWKLAMKESLGFNYSPTLFQNSKSKIGVERACFRLQQRFPEYIWHDSVTEGKPYTYPQVQTILDGTTTGGSRLSFEQDILNQKGSLEKLIQMVKRGQFDFSKDAFCSLHDIAAREDALEWGVFRSGSVGIAGAEYTPPAAEKLSEIFESGIAHIKDLSNVLEKAVVFSFLAPIISSSLTETSEPPDL